MIEVVIAVVIEVMDVLSQHVKNLENESCAAMKVPMTPGLGMPLRLLKSDSRLTCRCLLGMREVCVEAKRGDLGWALLCFSWLSRLVEGACLRV